MRGFLDEIPAQNNALFDENTKVHNNNYENATPEANKIEENSNSNEIKMTNNKLEEDIINNKESIE